MTFQKQLNLANKQFIEAGKNLEKKEYEKASTLYQNALGEYNSIVEKTEFVQYVRPKDSVIRDDILKNIQHGYCNLAVAYFNQNKLQEAHSTYHEAIDKKYLKISDIVAENCSIESQMMIIQNKLANDKYNKLINSEITQDSILQLDNLLKKDNICLPIKVNICCAILQKPDLCTQDILTSVIQVISANHKNNELQEHINYLLCQTIIIGMQLKYNLNDLNELATTEQFDAIENHALYLLHEGSADEAKIIFEGLKVIGHNEDIIEGYLINCSD